MPKFRPEPKFPSLRRGKDPSLESNPHATPNQP